MGKRPLVRRRGRGGHQFRSTSTGKVGSKATYPRYPLSEQHDGKIIDLVHERGREAPLAKMGALVHRVLPKSRRSKATRRPCVSASSR